MTLPNPDRAIVDPAKLAEYCLNPDHPRGRHTVRGQEAAIMSQIINILDVVALTEDLPERGLRRGQVGTVVESLAPDVFEVEFSDNQGRTYAMLALRSEQLMALWYQPAVTV